MPGKQQVFWINSKEQFEQTALQIFKYQAQNCAIYRQFIEGVKIDLARVDKVEKIPFLPIEFFKSHAIVSSNDPIEVTFTSSGTTGMITSSHRAQELCRDERKHPQRVDEKI
jgi:phenylacetate-coenzyme A ligase PaaK-like adenylate-forming protein